ncbi:hypothetical protein BJX62DRAFT_52338 [Aspergillus germanicus]
MPKKRVRESNRSVPRRGYLWQLSSLNGLLRSMRFNADKLPRFRFFFPFFSLLSRHRQGPRKNIPTILNSIPPPTARLQLFQAHNCHQRTRIKFCRHKKQKKKSNANGVGGGRTTHTHIIPSHRHPAHHCQFLLQTARQVLVKDSNVQSMGTNRMPRVAGTTGLPRHSPSRQS